MRDFYQRRFPELAAWIVILAAIVLALPSFMVPLGLPIEGDAVDYRIPIVRWMIRHGTYPNWSWTMVDDYPMLGELLMAPLYFISPSLARLVPLFSYLGLGLASGAIAVSLNKDLSGLNPRMIFLSGFAWALALRPAALQSNALMTDNLAAAFQLGAIAFAVRARPSWAGFFAACALATRYSVWGSSLFVAVIVVCCAARNERFRSVVLFGSIAVLGALPFMIRNYLVNGGHPFFPVDAPLIMNSWGVDQYGRGTDLSSFLLLPFDLLYTNTFVKGFFDYTLGKLIYVQVAAVAVAVIIHVAGKHGFALKSPRSRKTVLMLSGFLLAHTVVWFFSSQQLRFLLPALLVGNMMMLVFVSIRLDSRWLAVVTLFGVFSMISVQGDSIRMAFGKTKSPFEDSYQSAAKCFERAGLNRGEEIGLTHRNGVLGFFDIDFVYLPGHPYSIPGAVTDESRGMPMWIYGFLESTKGYIPWPIDGPCILKKA